MKNSLRHLAVPALLSLALATTSAWAQTPASGPDAASAPTASAKKEARAAAHAKKHEDRVEERINQLHSQLQITDQQSQQWDAFAQTMRDNAKSTSDAFHDRAEKFKTLNADDSMKSYASLAQLHAENMQKLSTAFSALYASMSDAQKKNADEVFRYERRQRAQARHHKGHPSHGHAASDAAAAPAPASN